MMKNVFTPPIQDPKSDDDQEFFNASEVAEMLRVSRSTLLRNRHTGECPAPTKTNGMRMVRWHRNDIPLPKKAALTALSKDEKSALPNIQVRLGIAHTTLAREDKKNLVELFHEVPVKHRDDAEILTQTPETILMLLKAFDHDETRRTTRHSEKLHELFSEVASIAKSFTRV